MVDDLMVQRCVDAGISAESLRRIELETGADPVTIVLVLVAAKKIGWQSPRSRADVQLPPPSNSFNVLGGDK